MTRKAKGTVLLTRARSAAARSEARYRNSGWEVKNEPVSEIEWLPCPEVNNCPGRIYLFTSANGVDAVAACDREIANKRPQAACIGHETAAAAQLAGFKVIAVTQDVSGFRARLDDGAFSGLGIQKMTQHWIYLSGADISFDLPGWMVARSHQIERQVVYRANMRQGIKSIVTDIMNEGQVDWVIFYSRRVALHVLDQLPDLKTLQAKSDQLPLPRFGCLSARIAKALPNVVQARTHVASVPTEESMIETLNRIQYRSADPPLRRH